MVRLAGARRRRAVTQERRNLFLRSAALVWDDVLASYRFSSEHPLNPHRLELTVRLIDRLGLLNDPSCAVVAPRRATDAELLLAHDVEYVDVVKRASEPGAHSAAFQRFGRLERAPAA